MNGNHQSRKSFKKARGYSLDRLQEWLRVGFEHVYLNGLYHIIVEFEWLWCMVWKECGHGTCENELRLHLSIFKKDGSQ